MSVWDTIFDVLLSVNGVILIFLGTSLGIVVGSIPGLTGAMLITLTLPFTFTMQPEEAMMLLVGMYVGAVSGGMISATLLRIPGTPASIMTALDGYPMAQKGRPGRALRPEPGAVRCCADAGQAVRLRASGRPQRPRVDRARSDAANDDFLAEGDRCVATEDHDNGNRGGTMIPLEDFFKKPDKIMPLMDQFAEHLPELT